jgi:uncharacterized RDD family membrane protein YckC
MMNDTVREELETKIVRPPAGIVERTELPKFEPIKPWTPQPVKQASENVSTPALSAPSKFPRPELPIVSEPIATKLVSEPVNEIPEPVKQKVVTNKLRRETNPTLVGFQPANPAVPDWRLQLQNSIRKRNTETRTSPSQETPISIAVAEQKTPSIKPAPAAPAASVVQNEKLANAIKRIEASKKTFGSGAAVGMAAAAQARAKKPAIPARTFPFDVVEKKPTPQATALPKPAAPLVEIPKPKLVEPVRLEKKKFDTNKLPPIPEPEMPLPVEAAEIVEEVEAATETRTKISFDRLRIWTTSEPESVAEMENELDDEIDDLAPFSMRFGASVFDLIIGGFAAGIILSPFLITDMIGLTTGGILAAFGTAMFVMFLYFTGTIAFMGRTFGMKLFAIEMIDAEENELPTMHQAAVHSAVYLISLMLFGLGFLPALFNEERRTMPDLVSGTLLIREY